MLAIRVARAYGRADVDRFLSELDHEQYQELAGALAIEPVGWEALRILIQRLSFIICQSQTTKTLDESVFAIRLGDKAFSDEVERARWEAASIISELEAKRNEASDG